MSKATSNATSDKLRKMALQLAHLVEISITLNSTLEIDQLLQFILDTATSLLDCEAVSIMLYDEKQERLFFAATTDSKPDELINIPIPLEGSIAGTILRTKRPITVNNVTKDPRHYSTVGKQTHFEIRSLLGVPMSIQERVTGVLEALNKREGHFTEEHTEILSIIASQAAVAIHNARLVQALQDANEQLGLADKLKSDFMAIASHELRTPLGIILGYATFLKEDAQGEFSEHAGSVLNAAMQLQTLVEDMTNMNLLYTGAADLHLQPAVIQEIVYNAYQEVASTAEAKSNTLTINLPKEPILINADPKLGIVFVNILNNAVRFTRDPSEIAMRMSKREKDVLIEVTDRGIGIPLEELERIFDQFYQVEDHMTRHFGGLGLGLAIARALTKLHGGRIWAQSRGPGKGTTLQVTLPLLT